MEVIPLDLKGKIYNKNKKSNIKLGGLFSVLRNHFIRKKCWKFLFCSFHKQTSNLCLLDERGQVYLLNFKDNYYYSLRLASFPVYSIEFIHSRPSNIIISYQNGLTIIVDTISNEIISTISLRGSDPICKIYCNPFKPIVILLSLSGILTLWNLRFVLILILHSYSILFYFILFYFILLYSLLTN